MSPILGAVQLVWSSKGVMSVSVTSFTEIYSGVQRSKTSSSDELLSFELSYLLHVYHFKYE